MEIYNLDTVMFRKNITGVSGSQVYFENIECATYKYLKENARLGDPISMNLNFEELILDGNAKLTNVMSIQGFDGTGLLIDSKMKSIIDSSSISPVEFCEVIIHNKEKTQNWKYFWLYFIGLIKDIDFVKSIDDSVLPFSVKSDLDLLKASVYVEKELDKLEQKYPFNNPEKFFLKQKLLSSSRFGKKIFLNNKVWEKYDFFRFKYDGRYFCNKVFFEKCKENNISGLDFVLIKDYNYRYWYNNKGF